MNIHPANLQLKTSEEQLQRTRRREGLRIKPYRDPGGHWTIGYGHLCTTKPPDLISPDAAEKLFEQDISDAEHDVKALVAVPLTQGQFDALVDFVFNEGSGALETSTLLQKLNHGMYAAACDELMRWVYADGKQLPGLVFRRREEQKTWRAATTPPKSPTIATASPNQRQPAMEWHIMEYLNLVLRLAPLTTEIIKLTQSAAKEISSDDDIAKKAHEALGDLEKAIADIRTALAT